MEELFNLFYETSGVCTDTRAISKDCFFICLKGPQFNGNTFASQALENGAKYVIVDEPEFVNDKRIFLVENGLIFLQQLANFHRKKFPIPVIGITGSNGKTTTKELLAIVLQKRWNVLSTIGNLNNHIGVPLTLLRLTNEHDIAIIEMGANKPNDIQELCEIAEPTHGTITNIGKAHLEGFGDFNGVFKTKTELYDSIESINGTVVYNAEDDTLSSAVPKHVNLFSFGTDHADINGELIQLTPFVEFKWKYHGYTSPILSTHLVGKYNFNNFLAAISFGKLFNVSNEAINEAVSNYIPTNNRSQVKKTGKNTLVLDCYNANPTSMSSALESFEQIKHNNKWVILGDMRELGKESTREHELIVQLVKQLQLKCITVGEEFLNLKNSTISYQFKTTQEAKDFLIENPLSNALILLKGSRGIGLEKLEEVF
jgi:UDP-N-acetylmuramoyl-tripeptide--D-alanyl-D-alanine ligase